MSLRFVGSKLCKQAFLASCPLHVISNSHEQPPMWNFMQESVFLSFTTAFPNLPSRTTSRHKKFSKIGTVMFVSDGAGSARETFKAEKLDMARGKGYSGDSRASQYLLRCGSPTYVHKTFRSKIQTGVPIPSSSKNIAPDPLGASMCAVMDLKPFICSFKTEGFASKHFHPTVTMRLDIYIRTFHVPTILCFGRTMVSPHVTFHDIVLSKASNRPTESTFFQVLQLSLLIGITYRPPTTLPTKCDVQHQVSPPLRFHNPLVMLHHRPSKVKRLV